MKRMSKRVVIFSAVALAATTLLLWAQERPVFRVKVDMVVLSFTVTDNKNKYINNLKPKDFRIMEDGIQQKMATFGEGNKSPAQLNEDGTLKAPGADAGGNVAGTDVRNPDALVGTPAKVP